MQIACASAGSSLALTIFDGDQACCEGARAARTRLAAGYPITPSTEVVEPFTSRVPVGGERAIQMEDELAASVGTNSGPKVDWHTEEPPPRVLQAPSPLPLHPHRHFVCRLPAGHCLRDDQLSGFAPEGRELLAKPDRAHDTG
jgi:hypothetical protein